MLWNKDYGAIMAATPNNFVTTEPLNMQIQRNVDKEICQTARINGSDLDKTVELTCDDYTITAHSDKNGFEIKYDFTCDTVKISVTSNTDTEYVLPIVSRGGDNVDIYNDKIVFNNTLCVSFDGDVV